MWGSFRVGKWCSDYRLVQEDQRYITIQLFLSLGCEETIKATILYVFLINTSKYNCKKNISSGHAPVTS